MRLHAQNHELVVEDILMLHEQTLAQQTAGTRVGTSRG